jgi:YrbI family 3-deoxy-D-manno-octulosonate 8-phosphate phosphatase
VVLLSIALPRFGSLYTKGGAVSVVAVIPARGGSKGVPGKNLKRVAGRSLVARAVDAARTASSIDLVIVSTDDAEIAREARAAGARVVDRPADIASDTAGSEAAVLHAIASVGARVEIVVFIQATSPFISPDDLDEAIDRVRSGHEDVVFAAARTHAFLWRQTTAGAVGVNHDAAHRPRRQDRDAEFQETGAFYVMRSDGFLRAGHRFFGRVGIHEVDSARALEIDTVRELELASLIAPLFASQVAIDVDALITDFDGVHTDDRAMIDADGRELVTVSRADGAGVESLRAAGIPVLILSRETNPVVAARGRKLGIPVLHGVDDKARALTAWAEASGVSLERSAYLGNDLNDLPAMALVGWPVAVADAHPEVLAAARFVLGRPGGAGAVRELADAILGSRTSTRSEPTPGLSSQQAPNDRTGSAQSWQFQLAE